MSKKISNVLMIFVLLFAMFSFPQKVEGRTIISTEAEIARKRQQIEENRNQAALTDQQISAAHANIALIQANIERAEREIIALNTEILEKEAEIVEMEQEIKNIVLFLELSSGGNIFLEYIFGAENPTDFIYRVAVTEQLTRHNANLVERFSQMIEENKVKIEENRKREQALQADRVKMQEEIERLNRQRSRITREGVSLEDALRAEERFLRDMERLGCRRDENLTACSNRLNVLPPDTAFWRPTPFGTITSEFGPRWGDFHYGIDIAAPTGTPVYSVANGIVTVTFRDGQFGTLGNTVYVRHIVNGNRYTTHYSHLHTINVVAGQVVTKDTIIGTVGSTGFSTGPHLHLGLMTGHAGLDYSLWTPSRFINPRTRINFPPGFSFYGNRTTNFR